MPDATDNNAVLRENLLDAGFKAESADDIMRLIADGDRQPVERLLDLHRKDLLDMVHLYTRQLDCLDYLSYSLKKINGGKMI